MKKFIALFLTLVMACSMIGCGSNSNTNTNGGDASTDGSDDGTIRIAYTSGIKGDNGYNDEGWQGVLEAQELYDFEMNSAEVDNTDPVATEAVLRGYAEEGIYDVIISLGTGLETPVTAVATDYPEQKFIVVDTYIEGFDNIMSIGAIDAEQAFLSGVLSGILTQGNYTDIAPMTNDTPLISYCIGMDSPTQRAGAAGYMAGVKYVNPDVEIKYTVVGSFSDPVTAKEITSNNIALGADIATGNCGGGALGILEACKENGAYFISTSPSTTDAEFSCCTSLKLTNTGVRMAFGTMFDGSFEAGVHRYGIADGYCEIGLDGINITYPQEILDAIDAARQAVINGEVVLPEDISELDAWAAENYMDVTQFGVKMD